MVIFFTAREFVAGLGTAEDRLQRQRSSTDKVLAQLSDLVRQALDLTERGVLESKHKDCKDLRGLLRSVRKRGSTLVLFFVCPF